MAEKELVMRLVDAADSARDREDHDLAELLDEAEGELELALDLIEKLGTPEALKYIARHSVSFDEALQQQFRAEFDKDVVSAAIFVAGRDTVDVSELFDAMKWNRSRYAYQHADMVMSKGNYARKRGAYHRLHNVGAKRAAEGGPLERPVSRGGESHEVLPNL